MTALALLSFMSATRAQDGPALNAAVKQQLIDSLGKALNRNYVYPYGAVEMSRFVSRNFRKGDYSSINDPREFASRLTKDMRSIHPDNHLSVRYDPGLEQQVRAYEAGSRKSSPDTAKERRQNFFFRKAEILKGNIGYIVFDGFADTSALSRETVNAAFRFVANSDALILDLRNNFGGRIGMAREIAGYFFSRPVRAGRSFNRISNTWTEEWLGGQPGTTGDLHLEMPLYILTSERTFSAAEGLAYNLKYLKNAVVVGDTTRGGAHTTRSFALGNGFVGFIPFTRSEHAVTGTDWEGKGVLPAVPAKEERALALAQALILEGRLPALTDTMEKRKTRWLLNDLQAGTAGLVLSVEILARYTGVFEEFAFTLEEGRLFCRNTHQAGKKDLLVAISDRLFKIDEQSQVEFVSGEAGTVSSIRLLWNDGWIDTIKKSR